VLAGAPLGDPADASPRLRDALASADVVAAEDTRRLRRLAADLDVEVSGRVVSYFDANEAARAAWLVERMLSGAVVAVVTDAGMPGVSDPGYRVVAAAAAAGIAVTVVPGPSAATAALAVSGLPSDRFVFEGFLPRRPGQRRSRIAELAREPRTIVLFESTHRIGPTLADLAAGLGAGRPAVLCRELTKTYEEIVRETLGGLVAWADGRQVRGEITLVVGGAPAGGTRAAAGAGEAADGAAEEDGARLAAAVAAREAAGLPRAEALRAVAREHGLPRRAVFDAVTAARHAPEP
jgi:16S rRNA (cytidine1402-2'-O)-methyltransferase